MGRPADDAGRPPPRAPSYANWPPRRAYGVGLPRTSYATPTPSSLPAKASRSPSSNASWVTPTSGRPPLTCRASTLARSSTPSAPDGRRPSQPPPDSRSSRPSAARRSPAGGPDGPKQRWCSSPGQPATEPAQRLDHALSGRLGLMAPSVSEQQRLAARLGWFHGIPSAAGWNRAKRQVCNAKAIVTSNRGVALATRLRTSLSAKVQIVQYRTAISQ
jgi:hypothetical protein